MAERQDLSEWVAAALLRLGGKATVAEVAKEIWRENESELRKSGDLLYTWQYDVRWAAHRLRRSGQLKPAAASPRGTWELRRPSGRRGTSAGSKGDLPAG